MMSITRSMRPRKDTKETTMQEVWMRRYADLSGASPVAFRDPPLRLENRRNCTDWDTNMENECTTHIAKADLVGGKKATAVG
jgi:hypothetical protein